MSVGDDARVLHLYDYGDTGGATIAAQSVITAVGGAWKRAPHPLTTWQRAYRTIAGCCDEQVSRWLCELVESSWLPWRPRVIHLHNIKQWGTGIIRGAKRLGIPVVWSCYDYWCMDPHDLGRPWSWWTYSPVKEKMPRVANLLLAGRDARIRHWMRQIDMVICLSRASAKKLEAWGLNGAKMRQVSLPISVPPRAGFPRRDKVLYLGGPAPHKGARLVDEIEEILRQRVPWMHVARPHGMPHSVTLGAMSEAACLLVPEQWDNPGPVVVAEAQLLGLPVIASNVGGLPEMPPIRLCPPGNPWAWVEAIEDPPKPNIDVAKERYGRERARAHLAAIYQEVSG